VLSVPPSRSQEMVKQMGRSVGFVWPRAQSNLYADLKRLAAEGLAEVERAATGRRTRTVYRISDAGRAELRTWLATAGAPPYFECEALVKLGFAPHTTKASALAQVGVLAEQAAQRLRLGRALAEQHLGDDGPQPHRLHVNAVMWRFLWEQHQAIARWSAWAQEEISAWPDTADTPANRERGRAALWDGLALYGP
jgi:DNA-binding PadR family transcriptional regulator